MIDIQQELLFVILFVIPASCLPFAIIADYKQPKTIDPWKLKTGWIVTWVVSLDLMLFYGYYGNQALEIELFILGGYYVTAIFYSQRKVREHLTKE